MKRYFLFTLLSLASLLFAQNRFTIHGEVRDAATQKLLPGANILVESTGSGAVADASGSFQISLAAAGEYTITVRLLGYDTAAQKISVNSESTPRLHFALHENLFQMGQVVVTATRSEKLMQEVPVVTELVTRAEMLDRGAEDLAQALADRPGMVIEPNASGGKVVRMNGLDAKHVLILKDGIPVAGKVNSRVEMNLLDIDNVDHIEVVKGPGSALYGSEAMGGVINIISRGFSDKWQTRASLRSGSFALYSGEASLSGKLGGIGVAAGLDHQRGGIDKNEVNINITGMENSGGFAKAKWENRLLGTLQASLQHKQDNQESDDVDRLKRRVDHETMVRRTGYSLNWDKTLTRRMAFKSTAFISDYFRTYSSLTPSAANAVTAIDTSKERLAGFRSDFFHQWGRHVLVDFGYDLTLDRFFSVRIKNREVTRDQHGFFAQAELKPSARLTLIAGGRYDHSTDLQGRVSPRLSAMWSFGAGSKLRAAWGSGFRAPNFIDMYTDYHNPYVIVVGNPDLKPEQSQGYSLGIEHMWNERLLVNLTVSRNHFQDMIVDYTQVVGSRTTPSVLSYMNVASATFTGLELQTRLQFHPRLSATLGYNYTHLDGEGQSNVLNTVYPHTASLRLLYTARNNRLRITLRDQFYSGREIKPFDNLEAQDYATVHLRAIDLLDLSASYQLFPGLGVRGGVTNLRDLTNKEYGPWIGRRFSAGLEMNF